MRNLFLVLILGGFAAITVTTVTVRAESTPADDAESSPAGVDFQTEILPLLEQRCFSCHGEKKQRAGLDLRTLEAMHKGGESGLAVVGKTAADSLLFDYVVDEFMPPEEPLPKDEVELLRKWLDSGAAMQLEQEAGPAVVEHDVVAIFNHRCVVCHGASEQKGGLDLRTREGILNGGKSGSAIVLGEPDKSLLIRKIVAEEMPPLKQQRPKAVRPVTEEELQTIRQWIELEAPRSPPEFYEPSQGPDLLVTEEDRQFWAYQPVERPEVPDVGGGLRAEGGGPRAKGEGPREESPSALGPRPSPVANPVDAFIIEKLHEHGLTLSPEADRRILLRRVTLDLTGLPPTPEEIEAFLNDTADDAYERAVDRLIDSRHFGERWGGYWLDAAGYAESEGRTRQYTPREHTWRYRDYVIRSLNEDKPYDQFLIEQIAGDELVDYHGRDVLTPQEADKLIATGFLRLAPDGTGDVRINYLPDRWEVIDNQLRVLGSAVLGTTIGCARCHNHKTDAVPQRDYFGLAALLGGAYDPLNWRKSNQRFLKVKVADAEDPLKAEELTVHALFDVSSDPSPTHISVRGNPLVLGRRVAPAPPAVFSKPDEPFVIKPPENGRSTGRRLALARWITREDHPLTARVRVNQIWSHYFGRGIVATVDNLGPAGAPPTHPELLDWLASEFVESGWSQKALHRLIVTSATYRQSSLRTEEQYTLDPENQWLSSMPLKRLDAEALRDSILKSPIASTTSRMVLPLLSLTPPAAERRRRKGTSSPSRANQENAAAST
jgi:mono/diheme cytochrome c family protein